MRKYLATLALLAVAFVALTQVAALQPSKDVNRFPALYVYHYVTASQLDARDSVTAKWARIDSASIGGYTSRRYAVLDSALTGFSTTPSDTLRLVCGATVSGYFVAGISGTKSGTAATLGHLPSNCRPSHTVLTPISLFMDNDTTRIGMLSVATTGIMTLQKADGLGRYSATLNATGARAIPASASFTFSRF